MWRTSVTYTVTYDVSHTFLHPLMQNLQLVEFKAGDVVFEEGNQADHAFWFLGGAWWLSEQKLKGQHTVDATQP